MKVRKAIITAAGWGTRFLPITKSQPKEMLPLFDRPLIQYAVEEAIDSGIEQIIVVTAQGKHAIEDYFDRSPELEALLERKKEGKLLKEIRRISNLADICYIRQKEQRGLGHAVYITRDMVANEPAAVLLPDDVIDSATPVIKQMLQVYERYRSSVIAVQKVRPEDVQKYGIIKGNEIRPGLFEVTDLVEKPTPEEAPSDLGIVGRYLLTPQIFDILARTQPGQGKEIQLTDGLRLLLKHQPIYACQFEGKRFDAGTPLGWIEASVLLAVRHPEWGADFRQFLRSLKLDEQTE
ncbi:MAG: UTP--glucose-1-phosphate uridylyltransferase GalU [Chloroflexi bacterium]|nr:UTP--glucose-1-phosphate uridylyltransferase GalU [Chloroflexota bacterium]